MNFAQWRQRHCEAVRFFSLARHALVEALRAAGAGPGDRVLLPEFICRDVLASLHALGVVPAWYAVDPQLQPATTPDTWPTARAVVAVNYFGFPQPLAPFLAYAARTGAVLIEDDAHGFLSRDEEGRWLGTRTELGIFSLRKTLPLADGAMLTCQGNFAARLPPALAESGSGFTPGVAVKARLRRIPVVGGLVAACLTALIRSVRRRRAGHTRPEADSADETIIPHPPSPHRGLQRHLDEVDIEAEIDRRRRVYAEAESAARRWGVAPVFPVLGALTAPYGFAFRAERPEDVPHMQDWARSRGFDVIRWPALPAEIEARAPDFFRQIHLVNFL